MEVRYSDGHTEMESFDDRVSAENAMRERLARADVISATIHKPGSEIVQRGKRYRLNALGQWERVGKKKRDNPGARDAATTAEGKRSTPFYGQRLQLGDTLLSIGVSGGEAE